MIPCIVHMIASYAYCDVLHSWCDVFDRVARMTYTADVIESRTGFKLDIELYRYIYIYIDSLHLF